MALGGFNSPPGGVPQTKGLPVVRGFQNTQYLSKIPIAVETGIPLQMGDAPARSRQVYYQGRFEPPQIAAAVAPAPNGWGTDLSIPLPLPKARVGFAFVPSNTAQLAATVNYIGWQPDLSIPLPLPNAQQGLSSTAFISASVVTADEWQPQLSPAPSTAEVRQGFASVPLYQPTAVTNGWQSPLSKAPSVAKAIESNTSLPFNTATPVDIYIPLDGGNAPPSFRTVYYNSTFELPFISELRTLAWQSPLSVPPPVAKVQQGYTFVPFSTAQSLPSIGSIPLDNGGAGPRVRQTYYQASFEPPYVPAAAQFPVVGIPLNATNGTLQSKTVYYQTKFEPPYIPAAQVAYVATLEWQQPLSRVPTLLKAMQGTALVPFDTVQFIPPPPPPDAQLHSIPFLATMGCLLTR